MRRMYSKNQINNIVDENLNSKNLTTISNSFKSLIDFKWILAGEYILVLFDEGTENYLHCKFVFLGQNTEQNRIILSFETALEDGGEKGIIEVGFYWSGAGEVQFDFSQIVQIYDPDGTFTGTDYMVDEFSTTTTVYFTKNGIIRVHTEN